MFHPRQSFAQRTCTALRTAYKWEEMYGCACSNPAGCSFPSKYQICCRLSWYNKPGSILTPDLQPGTLGVLPGLAEGSTMSVTAAHLTTKCFHL